MRACAEKSPGGLAPYQSIWGAFRLLVRNKSPVGIATIFFIQSQYKGHHKTGGTERGGAAEGRATSFVALAATLLYWL